jgi:murein DD-endopeptidase MepM/ murein hydrolase activator NlpD
MSTFTLDISNPFPSGYTGPHGGPGEAGHAGGRWYESAGNDLGADPGTPVHAVFDGKVSKIDRTAIGATSGKVYGAGIFVRASGAGLDPSAGDGVGCYYTHVSLASGITENAMVAREQVVGEVVAVAGIPSHLHFAVGVRTNENYTGVNIYETLKATANTSDVTTLTISAGGGVSGGSASFPDEHEPLVEQEN